MYAALAIFAVSAAVGEDAGVMQVTLEIRPDTLARFETAHDQLAAWLGFMPPLEWLMAFALDTCSPADLEKTLRQMGRDYLRNRRSLE